jgi:N-methylhydantoinase A/oxoprolinase/acetone carboxylase beta subunit
MRVGIDVGGTNTDAVLMAGRRVLAEVKTPTTEDVTGGVVNALRNLAAAADFEPRQVQAVMIGTTHFTNAVVEARRLMPTAAVRLGLPATQALPPMVDWPERLKEALGGHVYLCHGGHEFDGREISPLDADELRRVAADLAAHEIRSIAVSSVFSPVNAELEDEASRLLRAELPEAAISLSHEIGRIGLLERENAAIMNACLRDLAAGIVAAFHTALSEFGVAAPVYLSQNDGTLMSVDYAERYPVATFTSGPTNSMRGAALLSGVSDCAVVDIGGVRTNFRMPDVLSLGLGGGSLVLPDGDPTVGPESVGYELETRSLVFGGDTLTATDLAVAGGLADIGDRRRLSSLDAGLAHRGLELIKQTVAETVDRMKTSPDPIPVVVVGGGSILLADELPGASELVKPEHFAVANAIGAAIAQVGGEVDRVFSLDQRSRDEALAEAKEEATAKAVAAGAAPDSVGIVEVEEVPLAYLPSNATRIRVKAVGDLELEEEPVAAAR